VEFTDLVHGARRFNCADIGDFVLRRADGSASFFFSNGVDDAQSGVTHVLRGDDHLANTPRQLLILAALGLPAPQYGHLALITGDDGAPLSKRTDALGLRALREQGLLPEAIANHLFRLGHSTSAAGLLSLEQMAGQFDTTHLQRSPAHFQMSQLLGWQREAVHRLDPVRAAGWLGARLPAHLDDGQRRQFLAAVLPNLVLPDDVLPWVEVVYGPEPPLDTEAAAAVATSDRGLFAAAAGAAGDNDFAAIGAAGARCHGTAWPALFSPARGAHRATGSSAVAAARCRTVWRGSASRDSRNIAACSASTTPSPGRSSHSSPWSLARCGCTSAASPSTTIAISVTCA
jgi:glutamyl-tRNA synthetase